MTMEKREANLLRSSNIVNVIAKSHEEIEEQLTSTSSHLHLHRSTSLERVSTPDN